MDDATNNIPVPDNEALRVQVIAELGLRQAGRFDSCEDIIGLLQLASRRPIAMFTVMDQTRQWFHAQRGIKQTHYDRKDSLCAWAVAAGYSNDPFVVGDATTDERFINSPLVGNTENICFYAALPVKVEGVIIGVVAIADHKPGKLSANMLSALSQARSALEHILRTEAAAYIDRNSGLHNRRYFDAQMQREWRRAHRQLISLTIVMIEIGQIQQLRQNNEPALERQIIQVIADAVQTGLQRPADVIARYDDSRIVAVLPETDMAGTTHVVKDILTRIRAGTDDIADARANNIHVNIGAVVVMVDDRLGATHHGILREAESALATARAKGPDQAAVIEL